MQEGDQDFSVLILTTACESTVLSKHKVKNKQTKKVGLALETFYVDISNI